MFDRFFANLFKKPVSIHNYFKSNSLKKDFNFIQKMADSIDRFKITEALLTPNKYSRPTTKLKSIKGIVVHYIAFAGTVKESVYKYFDRYIQKEKRYASTHFVVDAKGILKMIPEDEVSYNCGAKEYYTKQLGAYPNANCLSIEMCHDTPTSFNTKTVENTIWLILMLIKKYPWLTVDNIFRHYDVTKKICPKPFVDDEQAYEDFLYEIDTKSKLFVIGG